MRRGLERPGARITLCNKRDQVLDNATCNLNSDTPPFVDSISRPNQGSHSHDRFIDCILYAESTPRFQSVGAIYRAYVVSCAAQCTAPGAVPTNR